MTISTLLGFLFLAGQISALAVRAPIFQAFLSEYTFSTFSDPSSTGFITMQVFQAILLTLVASSGFTIAYFNDYAEGEAGVYAREAYYNDEGFEGIYARDPDVVDEFVR